MLPLAFLKIQDLSLFFDEAKPFVLINETKILTPRLQLHTLGLIFGIRAHHALLQVICQSLSNNDIWHPNISGILLIYMTNLVLQLAAQLFAHIADFSMEGGSNPGVSWTPSRCTVLPLAFLKKTLFWESNTSSNKLFVLVL